MRFIPYIPDRGPVTMAGLLNGVMSPADAEHLRATVVDGGSVLVVGPTGSGRTTVARCLLSVLPDTVPVVHVSDDGLDSPGEPLRLHRRAKGRAYDDLDTAVLVADQATLTRSRHQACPEPVLLVDEARDPATAALALPGPHTAQRIVTVHGRSASSGLAALARRSGRQRYEDLEALLDAFDAFVVCGRRTSEGRTVRVARMELPLSVEDGRFTTRPLNHAADPAAEDSGDLDVSVGAVQLAGLAGQELSESACGSRVVEPPVAWRVLRAVAEDLRGGTPLHRALRAHAAHVLPALPPMGSPAGELLAALSDGLGLTPTAQSVLVAGSAAGDVASGLLGASVVAAAGLE